MEHHTFTLSDKLSVSLCSMLDRVKKKELPHYTTMMAGYLGDLTTPTVASDLVAVNLEIPNFESVRLPKLKTAEELENLGGNYYSGRLSLATLKQLAGLDSIDRISTKKQKQLLLDAASKDIGLLTAIPSARTVPETGKGIFIGIVDSGFDLSHPMFYDAAGKLRVKALLDQTQGNQEYKTAALTSQWAAGNGPGRDDNGHGTHVASTAGGSSFQGLEGIAPEAQFLLVKTDFLNVDSGVAWIFRQAGTAPCVVNLSLGGHIEVSRRRYVPARAIQVEIAIDFTRVNVRAADLQNWRLQFRCSTATVGRLDGWFVNQGFGEFRPHPLVETARTIGIPATSNASIAVASHVSKNEWVSDTGIQQDNILIGRSSPFSSLGPTRDGRWKPDISAPGQYLTAALANNSELSQESQFAQTSTKLVSIAGTSMATPVVTGAIALMLQKKPTLTPSQILDLLKQSARRDLQTGVAIWTPTYGAGKLDIAALLSNV